MDSTTEQTALQMRRRRRFILAGVSFAGVVLALLGLVVLTGADRLEPDAIVRQRGTYLSPRGKLLVVKEAENGMIQIQFESRKWWQRVLNRINQRVRPQPEWEFEREREWFLCFDQYERLWLMIGRRKPGIRGRKTSSGGIIQPCQSVTMSGFIFRGPRLIGGCKSVVSLSGDWRGVPPRFFEHIPGKQGSTVAIWGEIPPIPVNPPEFTTGERTAAAACLR